MNKIIFASFFLTFGAAMASAQFFDFESLQGGFNAPTALSPLTITTGQIPNNISVGQTIAWTQTRNDFRVFDIPSLAWSGRNTLYTENTDDTLINTGGLMRTASILTDPGTPEGPDVVRLLGLDWLGGNSYKVVAMASANDDATTLSGCTLTITAQDGFEFVLLQVTTEGEAFDNLTLTPVPEPATLIAMGLGSLMMLKRRRAR